MFYRRKILIALLEAFGGSLTKTDCQKLIFLFCLRRGKNYYDFFPYKYGNFSFLLYQDWNRLMDLGYLVKQNNFQLSDTRPYLEPLQREDRLVLRSLVSEVGSLRGNKLIRKVYLEIPYYASRSEIAEKILKVDEYRMIKQMENKSDFSCLFTIGYESLSIDAFINILISNSIVALVDVRKNPISMKYGFSKTRFADYINLAGLSYFHIPELGVPSELRKDLKSVAAYHKLFEYYSTAILPNQKDALEKLKSIIKDQKRVAITCFEADYHLCHRHKIAEYVEREPSFGVPVVHLQKNCTCTNHTMYNYNKPEPLSIWDTSSE
jgi:uncharacterized protein (DUF488 family)